MPTNWMNEAEIVHSEILEDITRRFLNSEADEDRPKSRTTEIIAKALEHAFTLGRIDAFSKEED